MPEIGERHDGAAADPQHVFQHHARLPGRLQGLRQDHVIEGIVRIIGEIGVGIALDDRKPFGDAEIDAGARNLDAAAIDIPGLGQALDPLAVADQELDTAASTGVVYWEGACSVRGTRSGRPIAGRAYVELTGYAGRDVPGLAD